MTRPQKRDRRKKDRRRTGRRKTDKSAPNWAWLLVGLGLGLLVAWVLQIRSAPKPQAPTPQIAEQKAEPEKSKPPIEQPDERFDFYDMLPDFEVVIPEKELDVRRDVPGETVTDRGSYILQTGSFQNFTDADRMKARLALLGLESTIQRVSIDSQTWHRVRIGPLTDLDKLNEFRRRLWDDNIQFIVVRSPE
ncbi:MAG: SPOR domain-containing protein [Pseudomonadota bacterium]